MRSLRASRLAPAALAFAILLAGCSGEDPVQPETGDPILTLDAQSVSFAPAEEDFSPTRTISITNGGGGSLGGLSMSVSYVRGSAGWLNATLSSTSAPATLELELVHNGLGPGLYNALVTVSSANIEGRVEQVSVSLILPASDDPDDEPVISVSKSSLVFSMVAGAANPASQTFQVTNAGTGTLDGLWLNTTYTQGQAGWLTKSIAPGTAPATVTVGISASGLPAGTYTASVSVASANASVTPKVVSVTLTITAAAPTATISLSATNRNFSATVGGANPVSQGLAIGNSGSGTLSGLAVSIAYQGGEPTGWLSVSLSSTTAPATLTFQATTGSLQAGTYHATVAVTSPAATNSPQNVNVTFTITAPTTLKVSTVTTGSSLDPNGYTITVFHNGLLRSSSVATNGSVGFTMFGTGSATVSISGVAGNCTVSGSTSRSVSIVAGIENSVTFDISCQASTRRVTLRNLKSDGDLLQDIVQVKVATVEGTPGSGTGVFVRKDLLIDDWAECLPLPGPTIPREQSGWFDPGVNDYYVFIGIGRWETNNVGSCTDPESTWFKRTFATDQNFNLYWSWVVVRVTGHTSGDWEWTITGSYQAGTLVITPAGNSSISFQLTQSNPIP